MKKSTTQMAVWEGEFGRSYTERNSLDLEKMEALYLRRFGVSRTRMNEQFLADIPRDSRILEVGANIGNQLLCLQRMGFCRLLGIELQRNAVEIAKRRLVGIDIIQGSAFDVPFKTGYFDLVFTSGVLIHIAPGDLDDALREIHRCAARHVWGFEYFAEDHEEIPYREHTDLLWKGDFSGRYVKLFPDLRPVMKQRFEYLGSQSRDEMFLLEKR